MSKRKSGLTREQHVALGRELKAMRDRLGTLTVEISHAYPQPVANLAARSQDAVDKLRSKLDDMVHRENSTDDNLRVYYPGNRNEE